MSTHPTNPPSSRRGYFVLRAIAAVIDYAIYLAFSAAYIYRFGSLTSEGYQVDGCGHFAVLVGAWIAWLPLPEAFFGKSLGKWGADLRVVNLNGEPVTAGQAFLRRLMDLIDFWAFFGVVGLVVASTNPLSQRVGDLVAKTRVIEDAPRGAA